MRGAAGSAPVRVSAPAEAAVAVTMEPFVGLELSQPTWRALARYRPRAFWRQPNIAGLDRPLYLHRADLTHTTRLSRRLTLDESMLGSLGEVDYTASDIAFSPTQPSQLDVAILNYYSLLGTMAVTADLDRRRQLRVAAVGGQSGATGDSGLPTHRQVRLEPELRMALTRRDALRLPVSGERHWIGDTALWTAAAEAEYVRTLSRRSEGGVRAGGRYAASDSGNDSFYPVVGVFGRTVFYERGARRLSGSLSVGFAPTLDLLRATYRPGIITAAALDHNPSKDWTLALRLASYVPAGREPFDPPADESSFSAELPVIYQPEPNLAFEAGVRHAFRSPHPENGFAHNQPQTWGYVGVTFSESTGRATTPAP